jgi:hypothetical protein
VEEEQESTIWYRQMKGFRTRHRYVGACVFVDHFSNLSFVYFQKSLNVGETIEAKQTFERC